MMKKIIVFLILAISVFALSLSSSAAPAVSADGSLFAEIDETGAQKLDDSAAADLCGDGVIGFIAGFSLGYIETYASAIVEEAIDEVCDYVFGEDEEPEDDGIDWRDVQEEAVTQAIVGGAVGAVISPI